MPTSFKYRAWVKPKECYFLIGEIKVVEGDIPIMTFEGIHPYTSLDEVNEAHTAFDAYVTEHAPAESLPASSALVELKEFRGTASSQRAGRIWGGMKPRGAGLPASGSTVSQGPAFLPARP